MPNNLNSIFNVCFNVDRNSSCDYSKSSEDFNDEEVLREKDLSIVRGKAFHGTYFRNLNRIFLRSLSSLMHNIFFKLYCKQWVQPKQPSHFNQMVQFNYEL